MLWIEPAIGSNPERKCAADFTLMYFMFGQSIPSVRENAMSNGCSRAVTTATVTPPIFRLADLPMLFDRPANIGPS